MKPGIVTFHGGDMSCGKRFLASDSLPWTHHHPRCHVGLAADQIIATCMEGVALLATEQWTKAHASWKVSVLWLD